jgi:hypothetical protein
VELLMIASVAAFVAGYLICTGIGPRRPCDVVTGTFAIGLALIVLLGKLLLLAGLFRPVPVTIAAVCCPLGAAFWLMLSRGPARRARATRRMLAAALRRFAFSPVGVIAASGAVALVGYEALMAVRLPPVAWDALYYHLISVAEWVRTGHFVAPLPGLSGHNPVYIYAAADSFPKDGELTAAWLAAFTHNTSIVALAQVLYSPLLFGGVYGICRHLRVRASLAVLAATLTTVTPAVAQQLGTNYVDVAAAAAVLAGWQFLIAAFSPASDDEPATGPKVQSLLLAGICLGLAAGVESTSLEYCAAALAVAMGMCIVDARRRLRAVESGSSRYPELPRTGLCMTAIAAPMLALGSFWYLRTWIVWGSPFYPIQLGPFPGLVTASQWTNKNGLAIPPALRDSSGLTLLARSWLTPGLSLGDIWLFVLLPAIAIAVLLAVRQRSFVPVLTVIAPLFVLDAVSPGAWQLQLEIPAVAAGAIALAVACESVQVPKLAAMQWRLGVTGISAVALWLGGSAAWAQLNDMSGWQAAQTVHQTLHLLTQPAATRQNLSPWHDYNALNRAMTGTGAVAFFANSAPDYTLPLAGPNFRRAVVVLQPYAPAGLTVGIAAGVTAVPRESAELAAAQFGPVVAQMRSLGASYLFVQFGTQPYQDMIVDTPPQLRLTFTLTQGLVYELQGKTGQWPATAAAR